MKKIACIGNITYDILAYTKCFPKEDTRTNYDELIKGYGGPAANAATVISKFGGHKVEFYGVLGNDMFSELIKDELIGTNINTKIITKENFTAPFSYIIISKENKTRTINCYRSPIDNDIAFNNLKEGYDIILTDGKYPNATLELYEKNNTAIKIIDAVRCNKDIIDICRKTNYIICSENFANDFMKYLNLNFKIDFDNPISIECVMFAMHTFFKKSKIAITVGSKGYLYLNDELNVIHADAVDVGKVEDTNAAGDIFHGAFTSAIANDLSFEDSLKFANVTSSLSVAKKGGKLSCPDLEEVEKIKVKIK